MSGSGPLDVPRQADVSALETRLDAIREQERRRARPATRPDDATTPDAAELAAVAENLDLTIARAEPRQAKALLRADQKPPRQRQVGDSPHLPRRHARGLRTAKFSGRYWARTSDPQLVELVLSQLS
jgi:hypothetical protein